MPKSQAEPTGAEPTASAALPLPAPMPVPSAQPAAARVAASARIGAPAPDFELSDLDGQRVKLVNYVDVALADLGAARAVGVPETEAYGCSVKYQN